MSQKCVVALCVVWLLTVVVFLCQGHYVLAADIQPFSSEMVSRAGGKIENAKVYVSGNKMRTEIAGNIAILRLDKNVMWIVMPSQQMYMEMPMDMTKVPQTSKEIEGELERVPLGEEMVNGIQTDKFKVTSREGAVYQWLTDSGFPVKMEAVDGSWSVEYKNIFFGPQPDYLFEVPAGLKKASMPFGGGSER
ncbi:MAG: hypothetical protein AMJ95_00025 [Omnitrophica WOR_2 bacterium SM23_72]|nr:MAG: hypothetical protein AMJ95_00025 [Omnitrophica WOR_2 bacterium SM23_72]